MTNEQIAELIRVRVSHKITPDHRDIYDGRIVDMIGLIKLATKDCTRDDCRVSHGVARSHETEFYDRNGNKELPAENKATHVFNCITCGKQLRVTR